VKNSDCSFITVLFNLFCLDIEAELDDSIEKTITKKSKPSDILNSVLRPNESPSTVKKQSNPKSMKSSTKSNVKSTEPKGGYKPLLDQLQEQTEPEGSNIQTRKNLKKVPGNVQYEEKKNLSPANSRHNNFQKAINNTNISKKIGNLQQLISEKHKNLSNKITANKTTVSKCSTSSLLLRSTSSTISSKKPSTDTCVPISGSPSSSSESVKSPSLKSNNLNSLVSIVNINASNTDKQVSSSSRISAAPPPQGTSKIFDVLSSMQLKGSQKTLNVLSPQTETVSHTIRKKTIIRSLSTPTTSIPTTTSTTMTSTPTTSTPTTSAPTTSAMAATTLTSRALTIPITSTTSKPKTTAQRKDKSRKLSLKEYQAKKQRSSSSSCAEDNMMDGFTFTRVNSLNTGSASKTPDNTTILPRKPTELKSNIPNATTNTTTTPLVPEDQMATNADVIGNILEAIQPDDITTNYRTENDRSSTVDSSKEMVDCF